MAQRIEVPMRMIFLIAIVACASPPSTPPPPAAIVRDGAIADAQAPADARTPAGQRRWFAGDLHMHAPPDTDVRLSVEQIADAARVAKLDFVVLTPHLWPARRGKRFDDQWRDMGQRARATKSPVMIPGVEWTTGSGHFIVAGVDVTALGRDFLGAADRAGAFVSVAHPFAVPTRLPVPVSHYDMSYRAWTGTAPAEPIAAVEVWNLPLALANIIARPGGATGEARAWSAADRLARSSRKRVTAVAGTDNHTLVVVPTTWVLAHEASEAAILEALAAGATCIGGPEAGSFRARGDDGVWLAIGGIVAAVNQLTLAWDGIARLFVDGVDQGEHTGGFVHTTNNAAHTYRIVAGPSRSGFIYANL